MNRQKLAQLTTILTGALIFIALWTLPHKEDMDIEPIAATIDDRIAEAVAKIENGKEPMKGILQLKDVLEEEPENIRALAALGYYSMQSGQSDKAVERFKEIISIDSTFADAWYFLGDAFIMEKQNAEAVVAFEEFIELSDNQEAIRMAREKIGSLKE